MPEHDTPWTPGPWRVRDEDGPPLTDVMVGDRLLATAYPDHTKHAYPERVLSADAILRSYAEAEANASLIAAAPSLYEALTAIVSPEAHVADDKLQRIASGRLGPTEGYGGLTNESASRILRARAALALARGETNG